MPETNIVRRVIEYLQSQNYKYLYYIHTGPFGNMIAVLDPDGSQLAVKIVENANICPIEDTYGTRLQHPNLHQVYQIVRLKDLGVKLYMMPLMTKTLEDIYHNENFRKDTASFKRMRKWLFQVLSGMEYLHSKGISHLNIRSENIFIDDEDNAILSDFSTLNYITAPVDRLCSPVFFRSPEYFTGNGVESIRGDSFDLWTYSLMMLNILTDDYFYKKTCGINMREVNWWKNIWPVITKSLKDSKFECLLKNTFPNVVLTPCDVHQCLHFIKFILKIKPDERPDATRVKRHLFIKMCSNPFNCDHYNTLEVKNPFKEVQSAEELQCESDSSSNIELGYSYFELSDGEIINDKSYRKNTRKGVKKWFIKKITKIFK